MKRFLLTILIFILLSACATPAAPAADAQEAPMALSLTSTAFTQGQGIPAVHSCDGKGVSPPLAWSAAPAGTNSFALIMDDPDAPMGTYVHWVIYNIPASVKALPEGMPSQAMLPDGTVQGPNTSGRTSYAGPCPPSGTHRYFFKLYALDAILKLPAAGKDDLLQAMQGHILAEGELMGTYSR